MYATRYAFPINKYTVRFSRLFIYADDDGCSKPINLTMKQKEHEEEVFLW
jgi:hypothetical protein